MNTGVITGFAAMLLACSIGAAHAQPACAKDFEAAKGGMSQFDPQLAATASQIKRIQHAGLDPNRYIDNYGDDYVLLTVKFHAEAEHAAAKTMAMGGGESDCKSDMAPYRKMADVKMIYEHYGLGGLLPRPMQNSDYLRVVSSGEEKDHVFMPTDKMPGMEAMAINHENVMMIKMPYCIFGACSEKSPL